MTLKRRKLSPSASSQSSSIAPSVPPPLGLPSYPVDTFHHARPSRLSDSATPGPSAAGSIPNDSPAPAAEQGSGSLALAQTQGRAKVQDERTIAKPGSVQAGSGDGGECGDECFLWNDLPMNKNAFRYLPCGPSPCPSPAPYHPFYRTIPFPPPTPPVHISWLDRSHFLRLSPDALTATTDRGFRSGRANVAVREGIWYFEATVLRGLADSGAAKGSGGAGEGGAGNAHVRVGWGRREAGLDAPVGADGYAYGLRDVGGEGMHGSRSTGGGTGKGFGTGDVVGCLISLPARPPVKPEDGQAETDKEGGVENHRKRTSIRYKGQNYFEMDEYPVQKEMDALVDRDGKYAQARREAEAAAAAALAAGTDATGASGGGGGGAKGKKTKNAKKVTTDKPAPLPETVVFRDLARLPGSRIEFYINGERTETAFKDLYDFLPLPPPSSVGGKKSSSGEKDCLADDGTLGYYPMVSCFGRGKLRLNFGPDFAFPTPVPIEEEGEGIARARGMNERWEEYKAEEREMDEREEKEMSGWLERQKEVEAARAKAAEEKARKKAAAAAKKGVGSGAGAGLGKSPLGGAGKKGKMSGQLGMGGHSGPPTPSSKLANGDGNPEESPTPGPSSMRDSTVQSGNGDGGMEVDGHDGADGMNGAAGMKREMGTPSRAGSTSTPGSPPHEASPGLPNQSTANRNSQTKESKGKKGKAKAKPKAKGKSKLGTSARGSSRAPSVVSTTPTGDFTMGDEEDAEGEIDLDLVIVGPGADGRVSARGSERGASTDADAEGDADMDADAEGEIDDEMDADGEVDEEYEGVGGWRGAASGSGAVGVGAGTRTGEAEADDGGLVWDDRRS